MVGPELVLAMFDGAKSYHNPEVWREKNGSIIGRVTSDSKSEKEIVPKDLVFDLTQPSILYIKMVRSRVGS